MPAILWQVQAPHFCAAILTKGEMILQAAPILNWTRQRNLPWLAGYFRHKGWAFHVAGIEPA